MINCLNEERKSQIRLLIDSSEAVEDCSDIHKIFCLAETILDIVVSCFEHKEDGLSEKQQLSSLFEEIRKVGISDTDESLLLRFNTANKIMDVVLNFSSDKKECLKRIFVDFPELEKKMNSNSVILKFGTAIKNLEKFKSPNEIKLELEYESIQDIRRLLSSDSAMGIKIQSDVSCDEQRNAREIEMAWDCFSELLPAHGIKKRMTECEEDSDIDECDHLKPNKDYYKKAILAIIRKSPSPLCDLLDEFIISQPDFDAYDRLHPLFQRLDEVDKSSEMTILQIGREIAETLISFNETEKRYLNNVLQSYPNLEEQLDDLSKGIRLGATIKHIVSRKNMRMKL